MTMNSIAERRELKRKFATRERVLVDGPYRDAAIAETFAKAGMDFVAIDMEHTTISIDQANRIITGVQAEGSCCLPRPVSHNNDYIKPLLEAGADGLIIPVINDGDQASAQIKLQKFPPIGNRSYGVNRAHGYGFDFDEYTESWNDSGIFIAQIETILAVENIEGIVKTAGLDAVMIGPYDIAGSLNVPGQTDHPKVREAASYVLDACKKAGISCMTQVADVNKMALEDVFEQGYTSVVLGSDLFVLWKWAADMRSVIKEMR